MGRIGSFFCAAALLAAGVPPVAAAPHGDPQHGGGRGEHAPRQGEARQGAPLFDDLGDHHHPVTTKSTQAQRYFDQGLILAYGFNHPEAERSFREAARLDPDCAMAWWGAALVQVPVRQASPC